jgi:choline dehydrogenase-like flavoprotein
MSSRKRLKPVDAVIVGFGWTGAIAAKTLVDAGLSVIALERGPARAACPCFGLPLTGTRTNTEWRPTPRERWRKLSAR